MANKINFITGETYTLAELFSEERQIIIPDLQRDYCWGNDNNTKASRKGELVSDFVNNLIEQFQYKDNESLNLGLLYGYEIPANHIQLCDGQQRVTTLFLLLGMINKHTGVLQQHLISDFEYKHDDKEPYLKYAIRESSLYFLSDLVCNFFINNTDAVEVIKTADWYFQDYDLDPSIQSMIKALGIIENLLKNESLDLMSFGDWLLYKLTFMYVDMETRKNGEETFVIINTTGEPLSATENLKPLVINAEINKNIPDVDTKWEDIETWFWQHRAGSNDTADVGFNEFLRWLTMLNSKENDLRTILKDGNFIFPIEGLSFEEIYSYWHAIVFLFEKWVHRSCFKSELLSPNTKNNRISQIECFELLPLIEYCKKRKIQDTDDRNLYRLYMFLHNLCKIGNVAKNVNDLVGDAIKISRKCNDILELVDKDLGISGIMLSKEEWTKLDILKRNIESRTKIEEAFWNAQSYNKIKSHEIWSGEILPLIEWASVDGVFDINLFNEYLQTFDETFKGECNANIDNVRRALLTRKLKSYPRIFSGYTVYSFAWEWSDWKTLINDNKLEFKLFFDDLRHGISCEQMIAEYPQNNDWAEFVHDERLMGYCKKKNLQWHNRSWYLMEREKWSAAHANINAYKYYLYLQDCGKRMDDWKVNFYGLGNTCVYFDQIHSKEPYVSIDVIWNVGENNRQVEIDLFMKPTGNVEIEELTKRNLQSIAESLNYKWNDSSNRYVKYIDITGSEVELYSIIGNECEQTRVLLKATEI